MKKMTKTGAMAVILALLFSTCIGYAKKNSKIAGRELTLRFISREHPSQPVDPHSPVVREIFRRTGVKLEIETVPQSSYEEKKKMLIATNSIPDVIFVTQTDLNNFASTGIFLPVSDYTNKYAPHFNKVMKANPEIKKFYINGKQYGFPVMGQDVTRGGQVPVIRTDLLKKLNLKVPQTWDQLYTVLKKFKEAYPQSYPWICRQHAQNNFLAAIAYPFGAGMRNGTKIYFDKDVEGGKYVYGPIRPEFKDLLTFLHKAYTDKLLAPDYAVCTQAQWIEKMSSGQSLFFYDNAAFAANFNQSLQTIDPSYKLEPIPIMANSKGIRRNFFYSKNWWNNNYAVSSRVKNPVAVVKFFDWLYSPAGYQLTNWGITGEHFTKSGGNYRIAQNVLKKFKDAGDPFRAIQGALGTGLLSPPCVLVDQRVQTEILPKDLQKWYQSFKKDQGMVEPVEDPPFNKEEMARLKKLQPQTDDYYKQEIDKFIMGLRPLAEFDTFAKTLREKGADEMEEIYNRANQRYLKSLK
jgi:putative aldouronate transport system substrate-binding protein